MLPFIEDEFLVNEYPMVDDIFRLPREQLAQVTLETTARERAPKRRILAMD